MTERKLSATDAALRERITKLSVHIPCGWLRGPLRAGKFASWQSCPDEDAPEKWEGCDVSREYDLCIICFRATAGGTSRWAWLACNDCRAVNSALESMWGFRPFALGRHSLMNGIGVRGGSPPEVRDAQIARLLAFARGDNRLREWKTREYGRLASRFDPLADIPLRVWQQEWVPGRSASWDAFSRLTGLEPPGR
jgi:hypothetical protein